MALHVLALTREAIAMNSETALLETILVVEDEVFVREVACEILRSAGYSVFGAANSIEAENVFLASGDEIALLLTDIILPGDNGHVLAKRLKQVHPSLKVLFATGYPEQISGGASLDCLPKPFSAATLLDRVARMLGHTASGFPKDELTMRACGSAQPAEYVQESPTTALYA